MRIKPEDRIGCTFARLTVLRIVGRANKHVSVECACICGNTMTCLLAGLVTGNTKSCGCLKRETTSRIMTTHGMSKCKTGEHEIWSGMKKRCLNQNSKAYAYYGGKGITVCERWIASFEAFYEDMGPRPSSKHSIDRIDSTGNYEPGNVRWATREEQARNRSMVKSLTIYGQTKCVSEWCEISGANPKCVIGRIQRGGWSHRFAVFAPSNWKGPRCGVGETIQPPDTRPRQKTN